MSKKRRIFGTKTVPLKKLKSSKRSGELLLRPCPIRHELFDSEKASLGCKLTSRDHFTSNCEKDNTDYRTRGTQQTQQSQSGGSAPSIVTSILRQDTATSASLAQSSPPSPTQGPTSIRKDPSCDAKSPPPHITSQAAALVPRKKAVGFPSLNIVPPAHLLDDRRELSMRSEMSAVDETSAQAHARRAFLERSGNRESGSLRLPGTAMRLLGRSLMFDSLFGF